MNFNNKNDYFTNKLKLNNVYLAKINFEDGYDKKLGTNNKIRPILIIDKFYNKNNNETSYIIAPIYSVRKNDKNYKYHCYINDWKNSFNKNNDFYRAKFKTSQIRIINKKSFVKKIIKGVYFYKKIECNSPIKEHDLEKLNQKIFYLYKEIKNKENSNIKATLKIYINRKNNRKTKNKELENNFPEYSI